MSVEPTYHVAHMNYAILRHDWDNPRVAEFVDNLDRVNGVAARSPGFVWRLSNEDMEQPQNNPDLIFSENPRNAVTVSLWETAEDLRHFVLRTVHGKFLKRREEWFEPIDRPSYVIWPIETGQRPTMAQGKVKLDLLATEGSAEAAYDFEYIGETSSEARAK